MKTIKKEILDAPIYKTRDKDKQMQDANNKPITVRDALKQIIDAPGKSAMSRSLLKSMDRVYDALCVEGDANLEDADHAFLAKHLDEVVFTTPYVYKQLVEAVDTQLKDDLGCH